ncbi:hypothetical protein M404DRAFT_116592, partial [Pisolithus tinctorius Marx 270]
INCRAENVILGLPWLQENNPVMDWRMGTLSINERTDRSKELRRNISFIAVEEPTVNLVLLRKITTATELAQEEHKKKPKAVLPEEYKDFTSIFKKPTDGVLPPSRPYDHAINL